jgi:hypothetical protein
LKSALLTRQIAMPGVEECKTDSRADGLLFFLYST